MSRDKLIATLWPETPAARARHSLSDALHVLRKVLGEQAIVAAGDELRLDPNILASDVAAFEAAVEGGDLERAVELYGGPFLDGFFVTGALEFDDWAAAERERLARAHGGALERLAEEATARNDPRAAAGWWSRRSAQDPYDARIAVRLMETLAAAGDRAGAIQHAVTHAVLLRRELDAEPDPVVTDLARRLRQEPHAWRPPEAVSVPKRGRPALVLAAAASLLLIILSVALLSRDRQNAADEPRDPAAVAAPEREVPQASIAILPFENMSADPDNEYFADGLAEEILNALADVPGLKVAARTSSFSFKDKDVDIPTIATALGVRTVLEGSVRKSGDRVRITAQLVNAEDGLHLWSETYDRDLDDIFVVQEEIARAIVGALEVRLATGAALVERPTENQEAHEEYLRGRFLWSQRTPESFRAAAEHLERAVELDPDFALAWAGLADVYFNLPGWEKAREAAERALELDPNLGQAHIALGMHHAGKFAWAAADEEFRRGIELDPRYPRGHLEYAYFLGPQGRLDEALEHARIALELDPLSLGIGRGYAIILMYAGRYEEALAAADRVSELDPNFATNVAIYFIIYAVQGRWREATEAAVRFAELYGWNPEAMRHLMVAMERHAQEGRPVPIPTDLGEGTGGPFYQAVHLGMLGQPDSTMAILERMYEDGNPQLQRAGIEPWLAPLHDDPRFVALLDKIGLAPVESARAWMKDR
jgi:TolB-like protein/DNA-binding SARP family transcriptional activator/Tfp pilus assembly protein PilF